MSTEQPGRLPQSVYRRRRVVVALVVLAVIVVIVLLLIPKGGPGDDVTPGGGQSSPAVGSSDTPAADDPGAACDPSVIAVTPVTDRTSYDAGENPMLSMTIVNNGAAACTLNVGTDVQLYSIVSGSDPIWNSRDCQSNPAELPQVLQPGVEVTTSPFPWDRTRSSPDTCEADREPVTAGGATYRLSVELGEVASESDTPFILN